MEKKGEIKVADGFYTAFLVRWVDAVRRFAWLVVAVLLLSTAGVLYYAVQNISINTDTADMISNDLQFRRDYLDFKKAFPVFSNNMVLVVDGYQPDAVDEASMALTDWLNKDKERFSAVFYPQGDPFFRRNGLLYLGLDELNDLAERLARAQPLLTALAEDMSLRGFLDVLGLALDEAAKDEASLAGIDPLLAKVGRAVNARLMDREYRLSWTELLQSDVADGDDLQREIVVQTRPDWQSLTPAAETMAAIRAAGRDLGITEANGLRLRITGSAALNTEEFESLEDGAGIASALTIGLVLILLMLGLRSVRLVTATLITLFAGLIWTAGFATAAVGQLNMISIAFAVLFIGLGVDFGIHFALRYQEERSDGADRARSLAASARGVGSALTLSAICAAIAFFSFLPTDFRGVAELGLISGGGMFIALFANLTLLPALLMVMPGRSRLEASSGLDISVANTAARGLDDFTRKHNRFVIYGAFAAAAVLALFAAQLRFDFDPLSLKDPSKESVKTVLELMASNRASPDTISVLTPDLESAVDMAKRLDALPEVDRALTLQDVVPKDQDAKLAVIEDMALFLTPLLIPGDNKTSPSPEQNRASLTKFRQQLESIAAKQLPEPLQTDIGSLAKLIKRYEDRLDQDSTKAEAELSALQTSLVVYLPAKIALLRDSMEAAPVTVDDLPEGIRARQIAADGRARVEVFPVEGLFDIDSQRHFVEAVRSVAPRAVDGSIMLLESGNAVVRAFQVATGIALLSIILLLAVLLRNPWDIGLVMVPLVLATIYTLGWAVLAGLSLNFANIIALPLLLGLGVASTVHLVMRRRRLTQMETENGLVSTSTPRAVLFSALTTIGSFGSLAISNHVGTSSMGILLTMALVMTLLCALVILPALMYWREANGTKSHPSGQG